MKTASAISAIALGTVASTVLVSLPATAVTFVSERAALHRV
ncbi:hypothetical protein [Leptolyngbya ectocarpi]|nr:hypothetical protein [Leptolyngbya ectocarpi]